MADAMKSELSAKDLEIQGIDTVIVASPDTHGELIGKRLSSAKFREFLHRGIGMSACTFGWDLAQDIGPTMAYAGWHTGWHDFLLIPDVSTLVPATWLPRTAIVIADIVEERDHQPVEITPRRILQRQVKSLAELGRTCSIATELEFHLYLDSFQELRGAGYQNRRPASAYHADYKIQPINSLEPFFEPLRRHLDAAGLNIEMSQGERGLGQFEINLTYGDPVEMCDRHTLFKLAVKDIAQQAGYSGTFMARPNAGEVGSSCHIHFSLMDTTNGIDSARFPFWSNDDPHNSSDLLHQSIGGILTTAPELMVFFAPTVNSYRRTNSTDFAGHGPTWGYDNRTLSCRVLGNVPSAKRLEWRVPGADVNPYLASAALIAAIKHGIANQIDPGPACEGDGYQNLESFSFPRNLRESVHNLRTSAFAKQTFGPEVIEHYATYYDWECKLFDEAVTDWELLRYFENT